MDFMEPKQLMYNPDLQCDEKGAGKIHYVCLQSNDLDIRTWKTGCRWEVSYYLEL